MRAHLARARGAILRWAERARATVGQALDKAGGRRVLPVAALLVGALAAALAIDPIALHQARKSAARYGLELSVGDVDLGWGRIWLKDVDLRARDIPGLSGRLDAVAVSVGPTFSVRRVVVHGGRVRLRGSVDELRGQLERWRTRLPRGGSGGSKVDREYLADGLEVSWVHGADSALVWGIRYQRGERETLSADRVRVAADRLVLDAKRPAATLGRRQGGRVIEHLGLTSLHAELRLDAEEGRAAEVGRGKSAAGAAKAAAGAAKAAAGAAKVAAGAGKVAAGAGKVAAAAGKSVAAAGKAAAGAGKVAAGVGKSAAAPDPAPHALPEARGERLRGALALLAKTLERTVGAGGQLELSGLHLRLKQGDQTLNIGPARLELRRQDPIFDVKFVAGGRETPLALDLKLPLNEGPVAIELEGGPVSLAALGIEEGDFGLRRIDRAELEAKTNARLSADGKTLAIGTSGRLSRLALSHPRLAAEPLENINLSWRASGEAALDGSRIRIDLGELDVARTRIELKGEIHNQPDRFAVDLTGGIPLASCQDMLDSAPSGLAPLLAGMQLTGTFSLSGKLRFDSLHPAELESRIHFVNGCRITAVPAAISPERFRSTFAYEAKDESGQSIRIYTGPDTPGWTRYDQISRFMEVALLVNEDGRFFYHRGFDQEAISNSLKENIKARRFVRGASTISMQLAKNLYLGRQKTLSRKLQEAALTMLLEQELTKQQILELYLNVIEFGPGIYGIGAAAQYYFNTTPADLSLAQAFHLASILPNPKYAHFGKDGNVTPRWTEYLRKLMQIARKRELITDQELQSGLEEQVAFRVADSAPAGDGYDEAVFVPEGI